MNIEYRLLTFKELDLYRQIRLECLKENPDFFGTTYEEEIQSKSLKFDESLLKSNQTNFLYGAFSDDKLVGICGLTQEGRVKTSHSGEINQMYVNENFTGQGIGMYLLLLTLDKAFNNNGVELIILSVVESNKIAIGIYKKVGFVEYGFLKNCFKESDKYWGLINMVLTKVDFLNINKHK